MKFPRLASISPAVLALLAGVAWSPASHACSSEPVLSGVCIMANPKANDFGNAYQFADGRTLQITQAQALYSLIGVTYGGDRRTNFNLPDLRGRIIVGAGAANFNLGGTGGATGVMLTTAQLPLHNHALLPSSSPIQTNIGTLSLSTTLSGLSATTSLAGVSATATMNGVPFSAPGSSLTLNASSGPAPTSSPAAHTLGTTTLSIYSPGSPSVAMASGSIGGSVSGTIPALPAVTVPVTFSGNASTIIGGTAATTLSGVPSFILGGSTQPSAQPALAMPTLPPYLALNHFIAVGPGAIYPSYQ
jgi:microcystin-dependent protein